MVAKTVLFISPQFPPHFANFVVSLRKAGCTVVAIGDTPYDQLSETLRRYVNEYYLVRDMEDYDQVYRGVAFLAHRHGRIEWVQSHNEHWLLLEARLREDFNIKNGYHVQEITEFCKKSVMKDVFRSLGLHVARGKVMSTYEEVLSFVHGGVSGSEPGQGVGYPIVAKPDHGVGASSTFKIRSDAQLQDFFQVAYKQSGVAFIFEEYIAGTLFTFDGLTDKDGKTLFYGSFQYDMGIMELLAGNSHPYYFVKRRVEPDVVQAGLRIVEAFKVRGHFFHIEIFRTADGVLVPLEANLRLPGANTIDMYNFAYDIDLYQLWADVVAEDRETLDAFATWFTERPHGKYYSCYIGRRERLTYVHDHDAVLARCVSRVPSEACEEDGAGGADENEGDEKDEGEWTQMMMHLRMPELFLKGMGEYSYYFRTPSEKSLWNTISFIHALKHAARAQQ